MKILTISPFGDGWYADVETDDGSRLLLHQYDEAGRQTKRPADAVFLTMAAQAVAGEAPPSMDERDTAVADLARLRAAVAHMTSKQGTMTKAQIVQALTDVVQPHSAVVE